MMVYLPHQRLGDTVIQMEHMNTITEKRRCILLTPLPRYLASGCCANLDHYSNRRCPDFAQHMLGSLELLRQHFKDFLYYRGMRHIEDIGPWDVYKGHDHWQ
jgi:hypothetical protein